MPADPRESPSEERLSLAFEAARMAGWERDMTSGQVVWARGFEQLLGLRSEPFAGTWESLLRCVHPEDHDVVVRAVERGLEDGAEYQMDFRVLWPDASVRWARGRGRVFFDRAGRATRMVGVVVDITEQKGLEERLGQVQRLQAVGQLAGGVAHDFNNLLTIVTGFSELALSEPDVGPAVRGSLEEIRKAAARGAELTARLLAFSQQQVVRRRTLDLNAVIGDIEEMLRRLIGEDVEVIIRRSEAPIGIRADPGQIEQILMNVATNARDAMPLGGTLTIEAEPVEVTPALARRNAELRPGPYALLTVGDTGCGMDEETLGRIFEPFFTTKGRGKGIGLGLSTVYGIVQQNGGATEVESVPGEGTVFRFYLPRASGRVPRPANRGASARIPGGSETVLVVEDEDDVRRLICAILLQGGYNLIEASSGEQALLLSRLHEGPLDLLVTDVVMPGLNGREVAERLAAEHPRLRVLFVSGYADDQLNGGALAAGRSFLQKPFTSQALRRRVRDLLDADGETREGQEP